MFKEILKIKVLEDKFLKKNIERLKYSKIGCFRLL